LLRLAGARECTLPLPGGFDEANLLTAIRGRQ
jgi:hypothetical protein